MVSSQTKEEELFQFITEGKCDEARTLLESGDVAIDCEDKEGMTPLAASAYKGLEELARLLVERGADVNTKAHKHGYTPLMFAALAGKPNLCRLLMDAGAYAQKTNTLNKTAGEMAAFVGQHESVTVINNHISIDEVEKFLHPKGDQSDEIFPKEFVKFVHGITSSHKVHPVALVFNLRDHPEHLARSKKLLWTVDRVFEKQLRCKESNEVMSMKLWLVLVSLREAIKFIDENTKAAEGLTPTRTPIELCTAYARHLLKMDSTDDVRPNLDRHLRSAVLSFPYRQSLLFETMLKAMARTPFGERPSAYDYIIQALFGQRVAACSKFCSTCGGPAAKKRCPKCKLPYCSPECQRFDWPIHKRVCDAISTRAAEGEDEITDIPYETNETGDGDEKEDEDATKSTDTVPSVDTVSLSDLEQTNKTA